MGRKLENEDEARRCLRAARAAGQTPGEWAREHGMDGRSLNAWRINLARATGAPPRLIELVPAIRPGGPAGRVPGDARYRVHVGDLAIELSDDFSDDTLVRLVRALRAC